MKQFKVQPAHLAAGLQKVSKAKAPNPIMPAVECIHAKTVKGGLILTCTDLETTITTGIAAEAEPGIEFLIPPQAYAVINFLKDEEADLTISVNKNQLSISYFTSATQPGDNVMKFETETVDNYPKPAAHKKAIEFRLEESSEFIRILEDCLKFSSTDDMRPAMTGVYFTEKELAATNAHQLLRVKYKAPVEAKKKFAVILPKSFVRALPILDSNIIVEISDSYVSINDATTKIISRVIDAKYPNYAAVIPADNNFHISVNAAEIKRNIRIASTLTTRDRKVVFDFSKTNYTVKGYDADLLQEIVLNGKCQLAHSPAFKGLKIAFNGAMLTTLLDVAANADIVFEFGGVTKAMVVNEDKYTLLLMPLLMTGEEEAEATAKEAAAKAPAAEAAAQVSAQATKEKKKVAVAASERLN